MQINIWPRHFQSHFPFAAAGLIWENTAILQRKVQTLPGDYLLEAGYNILQRDCKLLVPEQLDCFRGLNPKALSTNGLLRHDGDALDCPCRAKNGVVLVTIRHICRRDC